ncbi:MAG: glycosyltransferase [Promethearchaeota archaeon]|nr:MAG: glycosyltransferase [Candidatus Lokiarchaeota archaeon]
MASHTGDKLSDQKDSIWIFTFEYAGIAKVGGLGEVPANQAKSLADQYDFTVFMPSHGQLETLKQKHHIEKIAFNCVGQLDPAPLGINDIEGSYMISFYTFQLHGVNIILLSGDNEFTKKYLDDKTVYNPETFRAKVCLFSLGLRCYLEYLIDKEREKIPDIIHMHDYHVVIPYISIKQELAKNGLDVASVITIHLLTWPRFQFDFYKACGINGTPISILTDQGVRRLSFSEIFALCEEKPKIDKEYKPPTVEKIGAVISDLILTVSESYLKTDIIPNLGQELIEFKADFVWDGSDWDYPQIKERILTNLGTEIRQVLELSENNEITHDHLKKYLLTYKIGNLDQSPLINSEKVLEIINEISNGNRFIKNGNISAFSESGPLALATGRMSRQKGFETIFEALPEIIEKVPNAKILMLILPTEYSTDQIKEYAQFVKKYPKNLRIIFGVATDIFHLAHIAADVYCALSRWEPFGIIALEAMASKLPIISTRVGGLQESVLDVREVPEYGTGILIEKDNAKQFADSLITILKLADVSKKVKKVGSLYADPNLLNIVNSIPDGVIKSRVLLDPHYIEKIRTNAYNRVKFNFRWEIVSQKLIKLYNKVKSIRTP